MGHAVSLTQKYRPLLFKDVLDQDCITVVLRNIIRGKKYSTPFMFTGPYGAGKTSLARIFARSILCEKFDGEPCNSCPSCLSFIAGTNLAYLEIDAASNSGVDAIRKLRDEANLRALGNHERKVVVIDESQSITRQGNEALLKQLEDSTGNQVYIFCTTSPEDMHDTVRSRCFEFEVSPNTKESITSRLADICQKESIGFDLEALQIIATMTAPHVRDAIKGLEYLSNFGQVTKDVAVQHFRLNLDALYLSALLHLKKDLTKSLALLSQLLQKSDIPGIYRGFIQNILRVLKLKYGVNEFLNKEHTDLALEILNELGDSLLNLLEELLKRNKMVTPLTIESDLVIFNKKLNTSFGEAQFVHHSTVHFVPRSAPLDQKEAAPVETKEPAPSHTPTPTVPKSDPVPSQQSANIEDLDQTSKILKRYKSYSPELAMLMDKAKKSNSLTVESSVELKEKVKDFKQSLSKKEVKGFLENKIRGS